ncbi:MAG: class I SAM-dependent methyltransferase [Acidobacteriota bacterium]|nr:class I SAM-dependent methyltransferase [Acidobacteriota bacterium]
MVENNDLENGNFPLVDRVKYLKDRARGKKVLHLGCTDYPFTEQVIANKMLLHFELAKIADELYGFDFDERGIEILKEHGTKNLFRADLESLQEVPLNKTFDVIIAGEMIEHLSNPGLFLRGIQRFMNPQTNLIITTINAYCGMRMFTYGLRGRGGAHEPVHPDHVAYYSFSTLKVLVERHDLKVKRFAFYNTGEEHRKLAPWKQKLANDISVRIAKQWADGIIAECGLKG